MTGDGFSRRRVLALAGSGVASGIAGCAGRDGGSTPTGEAATPGPTTTATTRATTTEARTETTTYVEEAGATVEMEDTSFVPLRVSVEPGTTVEWVNRDFFGHDVVSIRFHDSAVDWEFQSRTVAEGETVRYTFEEPGVYEYFCEIHGEGRMCGVVLVGDVTLEEELLCE